MVLFDEGYALTILNAEIGRASLSEACAAGTQAIRLYGSGYWRALPLALYPGAGATELHRWRKITASLTASAAEGVAL